MTLAVLSIRQRDLYVATTNVQRVAFFATVALSALGVILHCAGLGANNLLSLSQLGNSPGVATASGVATLGCFRVKLCYTVNSEKLCESYNNRDLESGSNTGLESGSNSSLESSSNSNLESALGLCGDPLHLAVLSGAFSIIALFCESAFVMLVLRQLRCSATTCLNYCAVTMGVCGTIFGVVAGGIANAVTSSACHGISVKDLPGFAAGPTGSFFWGAAGLSAFAMLFTCEIDFSPDEDEQPAAMYHQQQDFGLMQIPLRKSEIDL